MFLQTRQCTVPMHAHSYKKKKVKEKEIRVANKKKKRSKRNYVYDMIKKRRQKELRYIE